MKKYDLYKQMTLLLFLILSGSCSGQPETRQKQVAGDEVKVMRRSAKTIRTSGTDKYQAIGCSLQDKAGNLWFGTSKSGVYRYDGTSFGNFTEQDGLNDNRICCMLEDRNGNIWIGTNEGLCRYDGKTFTAVPVSLMKGSNYFSLSGKIPSVSLGIRSMFQDSKGNIWCGTQRDGVYRYDGTSFTRFLQNDAVGNKENLLLNAVTAMIEDKTGNIWFATWFEGLCRYDGRSLSSFKPNGEVWYGTVFEDSKGGIWAGRRSKGVCRFDGKNFMNVLQYGILDSCCIMAITEDRQGNMWFGSEASNMTKREVQGGLWRYNGTSFKNFTEKEGLGNYSVFSILEDRNGNIWAGTRNNGLYRYDGKVFVCFSE